VTQPPRAIVGLAAPDFVSVTINLKLDLTGLNPLATTGELNCWGLAVGAEDAGHSASIKQSVHASVDELNAVIAGSATLSDPSASSKDVAKKMDILRESVGSLVQGGLDVPYYYGSKGSFSFPITNGEYHGTASVSFRISRTELLYVSTHTTFVSPDALVSCWLYLNGRQALYGPPRQLPDANNVNLVVPGSSLFYLAMTPVPGL